MTSLVTKAYGLEVKTLDAEGRFSGLLSTYGNVDLVGDICDPGCWDESVMAKGGRIPLLWQHDQGEPIGTLTVTDTRSALAVEGRINLGTIRGREAHALLRAGDLSGMSVGFALIDASYDDDGIRHIVKADLWEGSLVTFPANPSAHVSGVKTMTQTATLRMAVAGLAECKSLTDEQRERVLRAIDEALADEPAPAEAEDEKATDDEREDESSGEPSDDAPGDDPGESEDEEELKALMSALLDTRASALHLQTAIRGV